MRLKNQKLTDLELEAKDKALALMEETIAKRLEQEDDIKRLNEVSFFTAIRTWIVFIFCFNLFICCCQHLS